MAFPVYYLGEKTAGRYSWLSTYVPAALVNADGTFVGQGTWNGETVVRVNADYSIQRGVAGGPPAGASTTATPAAGIGTVYDAYAAPSIWETLLPPITGPRVPNAPPLIPPFVAGGH